MCVSVGGWGRGTCCSSTTCRAKSPPHPASVGRGFAWARSHSVIDPLLIGCDDENFGAHRGGGVGVVSLPLGWGGGTERSKPEYNLQ